jgi:hypothetical protein
VNTGKVWVAGVVINARIVRLIILKVVQKFLTKMGAELLKFDGTFENTELLKDFQCPQCWQPISEQDITEKNYQL